MPVFKYARSAKKLDQAGEKSKAQDKDEPTLSEEELDKTIEKLVID
jgi:hypothetical protein